MLSNNGFGLVSDSAAAGGMISGMQGRHLQGMTNDVMSAINQENQSRVAQAREQRRMEHEKEMERMRQQSEQNRANALIQRLGQNGGALQWHNPAEGLYLR